MADEVEVDVNADIDNQLVKVGAPPLAKEAKPLFQEISPKIPVSRHFGALWKARIDQSCSSRSSTIQAWNEAVAYFAFDQSKVYQSSNDNGFPNRPRRTSLGVQLSEGIIESENHVYINTTSMAPQLYMQDPDVSVRDTSTTDNTPEAEAIEELLKVLVKKKNAPGIGLRTKIRKAIVQTQLQNSAYLVVGYNHRDTSIEGLQEAIIDLEQQWAKAKSTVKIKEIEGKLEAIYKQVAVASPMGPTLKLINGKQVVFDGAAEEDDLSDANWIGYYTFENTMVLAARFMEKHKDNSYKSLFKPTHIVPINSQGSEQTKGVFDGETLHNLKEDASHESYGFTDEKSFKDSQLTKVWYIWDKTMRRVYLFSDASWQYPIWVWDDPFNLPNFSPIHRLYFHIHPTMIESPGEVSYYLDQQDAINSILSERAIARAWARRNVFYAKGTTSEDDVAAILKGPTGTAKGLDVPDGKSLDDVIPRSVIPPSMNYPELFETDTYRASIDRIAGSDPALRGEQYRTNTTNQAVQRYADAAGIRTEMRVDNIEDVITRCLEDIFYLCAQFMPTEQLQMLIGERAAEFPIGVPPDELSQFRNYEITVGSMEKPTSYVNQQRALEIGQVLGQYADAAPIALLISLKAMERAFDEVVINDKDWEMITSYVEGQLQLQQEGSGDNGEGSNEIQQMLEMIDSLPPEAKRALGDAMAEGVPVDVAVQEIIATMNGQGQSEQPPVQ